jgi:hypothetical protein
MFFTTKDTKDSKSRDCRLQIVDWKSRNLVVSTEVTLQSEILNLKSQISFVFFVVFYRNAY